MLLIASTTPLSSSSQDLADILSVPSGNVRSGTLSRNDYYNSFEENNPEQDNILNETDYYEDTSRSMGQTLKPDGNNRWKVKKELD